MKIGVRTGPKRASGSANTPLEGSRQGTPKPSVTGSSGLGSGAAAHAAADMLKKNLKRKMGAVEKASFEDEDEYGEVSEGEDGLKARSNSKDDKGIKKKKPKVKAGAEAGATKKGGEIGVKIEKGGDKSKGSVGSKRPPPGKRPPGQLAEGMGNGGGVARIKGEDKG